MKVWEVVGYTADADIWCPDCCPYSSGEEDREGNEVHPIFASDEGWENDYCSECRQSLGDIAGIVPDDPPHEDVEEIRCSRCGGRWEEEFLDEDLVCPTCKENEEA